MGKKKKEISTPARELTRKELRKEQRKFKKQARSKFFEAKKLKFSKNKGDVLKHSDSPSINDHIATPRKVVKNSENKNLPKKTKNSNASAKRAHDNLLNKMKNQRKRQLSDANKEEDKTIKVLEKKLKLNKKKSVSSKGFSDCGLDYILDVCDPEKIQSAISSEVNFDDSDSDFDEDFAMVNFKNKKAFDKDHDKLNGKDMNKDEKMLNDDSEGYDDVGDKSVTESSFDTDIENDLDSYSENENLTDEDDSVNEQEREIYENSVHSESDNENNCLRTESSQVKPEIWEDIYGRLRDEKGNILKPNDGKYLPPQLRNSGDSDTVKKHREIMRQLKGLLNRLALNNMHSIASQIEDLYARNSRHSINEALLNLYIDSIVSPVLSPERLVIDHSMLIGVLHANIGSEIGAYMLQNLVLNFNSLLSVPQDTENKKMDNLMLLISYLYNFKIFEAVLMFDILNALSIQLTEKNIDLILIALKSVGFLLRKDDPMAMKGFLLNVQKKINLVLEVEDNSRMRYMLDILLSIKNNNVSKLSEFDPEHHEHLKKVLKSVVRSGNSIVALRIGLDDLLKVEEKGRWWLVGSAWNKGEEKVKNVQKDIAPREEFSAQLLSLAKKQKMNTDNRRNIFCILMSAEDFHDAFEKLLRLGLKGQQEREIPLVILHCLLQEKNYNPYYAYIADQLCSSNRRHQMSLQCALWDKFRALNQFSSSQINSLSKFLAQVLLAGSIPISVLKVVEFTKLDKPYIRLLRQTILSIAKEESRESVSQIFLRVSKSKKLSLFREALRLFIHHFVLRNMPDGDVKDCVLFINSRLIGDID